MDKTYKCRECKTIVRTRSVTLELADRKLCPQCYTILLNAPQDDNVLNVAELLKAANGMPTEEAVMVLRVHAELKKMGERTIANGVIENDVSLKEAVKYITHGPEMVKIVEAYVEICELKGYDIPTVKGILTKLEAK